MSKTSAVSDRSLRIFVSAVRHGSLTAAARELDLSQSAVSHAIRRLESQLGPRLLDRSRTGVTPTSAGAALVNQIDPAFAAIDGAVAATQQSQKVGPVSLSVSTSLASWWLLPRLPDFKREHPDVSLRLITADTDDRVDLRELDLWIPLGLVDNLDLDSTTLCMEQLIPVATPELAATLSVGKPQDLLDAPLLHLEERYAGRRFDWRRWFRNHGVDAPVQLAGDTSTDYSLVLQAALEGQGVALGWGHIVGDLIESGRLTALWHAMSTNQPFVILSSSGRQLSDGAIALRDWLVATLGGDQQ